MGCLVENAPVVTAASDYPEFVVEWLPLGGPFAAGADWCDITTKTAATQTGGGRQYETGQFQSTSGTFVLKDAGRQFDVENVDGSFYPWLKTSKQIRKSAVWGGVRYPLWHGYITDFGDAAPDDAYYQQTISAKDAFVIFEQIDLPGSWYELAASFDHPAHWWKLDEENVAGAVPIDSGDVRASSFYDGGSPTLGEQAFIPFDGSRQCTRWDGASITIANYTPADDGIGFSVEGWFQLESSELPATSTVYPLVWFGAFDSNGTTFRRMQVNVYGSAAAAPAQLAATFTSETGINEAVSGIRVDDGSPHHFVATINGTNGVVELYLDGVLVDSDASVHTDDWTWVSAGTVSERGAIGTGYFTSGATTFPGVQSHLLVYEVEILTAGQVLAHYTAGATGFAGDTTDEAVGRILDYVRWPSVWRDLDTACTATIGGYELSGTLLSYLQSLADTEAGALFIDAENRLVLRGRYAAYLDSRSTTSQATFGDAHSSADAKYVEDGFSLRRDEALIRNPITVTRTGGVSITVEDTDLSNPDTGYGPRPFSAPATKHELDSSVGSHARWLLAHFKDLEPRLASMTVKSRTDTSMWPLVLGMKFQDRITVERTPLGAGTQIVSDQYVESIVHKTAPKVWDTSVVGTPADDTSYLIVGVGEVGVGRVG